MFIIFKIFISTRNRELNSAKNSILCQIFRASTAICKFSTGHRQTDNISIKLHLFTLKEGFLWKNGNNYFIVQRRPWIFATYMTIGKWSIACPKIVEKQQNSKILIIISQLKTWCFSHFAHVFYIPSLCNFLKFVATFLANFHIFKCLIQIKVLLSKILDSSYFSHSA